MEQADSESKRLKVRTKLEPALMAFIHSSSWSKVWNFCQKKDINYYFYFALGRFYKKLKHLFSKTKTSTGDFDLWAIGQSHIDAAWLWTKRETIRRVIITFQENIAHMKKYPYYTYSQASPQYYDWVRRLRPELFEQMKRFEKEGKWEIVGGMWVEPDLNLPSGESLVRQRLYGQLFFYEHFGKFSKIASIEDSFGFTPQLPQIWKKSGAESFWTTKITWNDYSEFPFTNFIWRGLDGSELFTHLSLFQITNVFNLTRFKRTNLLMDQEGLVFDSSKMLEEMNSHKTKDLVSTVGIFYGFGDGGLGPLKEEIDLMTNMSRWIRNDGRPLIKFCNMRKLFDMLREECGTKIPTWNDELYLELHRGCYTSQAETKRLNRLGEITLRNCEIVLTFFSLFFKDFDYPRLKIEKLWKDLLFNQFHDILPGSSIQDVYWEQEQELENVVKTANAYISEAMKNLLLTYLKKKQIKDSSNNILIINTLPWTRGGYIKSSNNEEFYIERMPSFSQRILSLEDLKQDDQKYIEREKTFEYLNQRDKILMENSQLRLIIDKITGKITSLFYKKYNRELIRNEDGISVHVYKEGKRKYPAWEISPDWTIRPVNKGIVKGIKLIEDSNRIKKIELIYKFKHTKISHFICLRPNSDMVEFKTDIDVHDKYMLFKTRFPLDLNTDHLMGEMSYGNVKRPLVPRSEMEEGKFEFPAHKYVDISEEDFGVTLLNNSKYGFSNNEKGLYLTLLHTPERASSPFFSYLITVPKDKRTKHVDIGFNSTEYALWIHDKGFKEAHAWRKGYEYNYPLLNESIDDEYAASKGFTGISMNDKFKNIFKEGISLISVDNPNIILQVVKPPELIMLEYNETKLEKNEVIIIIRLFETTGSEQTNVKIEFDNVFRINKVMETDLLERDITPPSELKDITIQDHRKLIITFSKFEIKTYKLWLSM